ncbi:hypothetical protein MKW94_015639, partial [Papaver nudicaule]|nr:hypothetical protein [Papaver nudicaule]
MSTGGGGDQESQEDRERKAILEMLPKDFPKGFKVLLLIDDDSIKHVEQPLKELEYQVTACDNVANALSLLRDDGNKFDIVLCMDNAGGFELLDKISKDEIPVA